MHRRRDRVAPRCHPIRRRADRGRACSCGGRPRRCAGARRAPAVSVALGRGEPPHRRPTWPGRAVEPAADLRAVPGAGRAPPRGEHLALRRRAADGRDRPRADVQSETSSLRRDQPPARAHRGAPDLCPPALDRRRRKLPRHRRAGRRAGAQGGEPRLLPAGGPRRARRRGGDADARGDLGRVLRSVRYEAGDSPRTPPLPACGESTGGLRPPFLAQRTPMRSIGYGAKRAGEGGSPQAEFEENPPHPNPLPTGGERERTEFVARLLAPLIAAMEWVNIIIQGVLIGGLYAMFAAGLALIFGVMRLVNIAHGDLIVLAAYIALMT